jgi:hypothetical protein
MASKTASAKQADPVQSHQDGRQQATATDHDQQDRHR